MTYKCVITNIPSDQKVLYILMTSNSAHHTANQTSLIKLQDKKELDQSPWYEHHGMR